MSEVRCPMCSKPNPEDAEVCEFCGARIKPLYIEPDSRDEGAVERPPSPEPPVQPAEESKGSDWLSRMRGGVEDEIAPEGEGFETDDGLPERGSTDLLGRFRGLGLADEQEDAAADSPEPPLEGVSEDEPSEGAPERGSTDLLGRFRGLGLAPDEEQPADEISTVEMEEVGGAEEDELDTERGSTDLLGRLSDLGLSEEQLDVPDEAEIEAELAPDQDEGITDLEWTEIDLPDEEVEPPLAGADLESEGEVVPDWLSRVRERQTEDAQLEESSESDDDWLLGLEEEPLGREVDQGEPQEELEKIPPFVEYEPARESLDSQDTPSQEPFLSDSLIADDEDHLQEELSDADEKGLFDPMEIEKGTSPLQDLFEDLDKKLQTGELPALEPELIPGPEHGEDVDAALEKLLEEFDEQTISDASLFEDGQESEGDPERELPIEEIFSDFPGTSREEESVLDDLFLGEEVPAEAELSIPQEPVGEFDVTVEDEEDEFEGIFEGVEAPSPEDIAALDEAIAEVESLELGEGVLEPEFPTEVEKPSVDEFVLEEKPGPAAEPPSEVDIAAIEKLFGDFDTIPADETEKTIDSGALREITGEAPDKGAFTAQLEALDVPGVEEGSDLEEADREFEAADIEPDSLAPGSDQLAVGTDTEDLDEQVELLSTLPTTTETEAAMPSREELADQAPSWLREGISEDEMSAAPDADLPHVPALIMGDEEIDLDEFEGDFLTAELSAEEMPSWLEDLGADVGDEELEEEQVEVELARAKLPPWLEAMRPLETFRAEPEIVEEEEEEITEAAGPLAGLRGVLLAEPVVAMPRTASAGAAALDISERHYTNTEILRQMIGEEELEQTRAEEKAAPLPLARWIISLLLLLAVAVPTLLGFPNFKEPFAGPHELNPFLTLMDSIPLGEPALLIYDYEPAFSPEMDAVAGAMVEGLIARRQPLITLSSRPSGALLADRMILRIGADRELENGVDYLHLGYLPGGATGIQLFAGSPRSSISDGFRLPEDIGEGSTWDLPITAEILGVADFSAIALLTSSTETARNWIEQLTPYLADTPLVIVASAGSEPLVRPYYESPTPQVQGILSGIHAGVKYEVRNGTLSDATQNWNSFGTAILIAELILFGGAIYGAGRWFFERRLNSES